MVSEKECWACSKTKPLTEFNRHPQSRDGRVNRCRECQKNRIPARMEIAATANAEGLRRRYYRDPVKARAKARKYYYYPRNIARTRQRYIDNRDEHLERERLWRIRTKQEVIEGYGGRCVCCGETNHNFMTLDHVNSDGSKHRKEIGGGGTNRTWRWALKNRFPSNLQLLCFNCNCGRHLNGGICPHLEAVESLLRQVA